MTALLQSLMVGACLGITPAIKFIPTAVLWGYFAYMAIESLEGSQFWDRLLLLVTDPRIRTRCAMDHCLISCISRALNLYRMSGSVSRTHAKPKGWSLELWCTAGNA